MKRRMNYLPFSFLYCFTALFSSYVNESILCFRRSVVFNQIASYHFPTFPPTPNQKGYKKSST